MAHFIECTSLSISYDNLGLATVSYTIVSDSPNIDPYTTIATDEVTFTGFVTSISMQPMPNTDGWYEAQITLITTTN